MLSICYAVVNMYTLIKSGVWQYPTSIKGALFSFRIPNQEAKGSLCKKDSYVTTRTLIPKHAKIDETLGITLPRAKPFSVTPSSSNAPAVC